MDKKVTLLIPTRFSNRWIIDLCLRTIRKYTDYPYKIIVGDAGMDRECSDFLKTQADIQTVNCPDPIRPKDHLVKFVDTPYFMFLHDDVQILKQGWLRRRIKLMESNERAGIVGVLSNNYKYGWRKIVSFSSCHKRFFPLAMLVKKVVQEELELHWGKIKGFDTGGVAYLQFLKQKKWKFIHCKFSKEIKHWSGMTWIMRKKILNDKTHLNIDALLNERNKKLELIQQIILTNNY
jgi:hypothetical protein